MEEKQLQQEVHWGNAAPAMTFIFTMITMLFWGMFQGIFSGKTELIVGLIQLACFPAYLIGAISFLRNGDSLNGNVFLIFATLFGGIGGVSNVAAHFGTLYGWGLDPSITAIPFIWGGVALVPIVIILRKAPAMSFLVFFTASIFLIAFGLVSLGILPISLYPIFKWMALFIAVVGLYTCLDGLLQIGGGKGIPQGPSIFK